MFKALTASVIMLSVAIPVKAQVGPGMSGTDHIGGYYHSSVLYAQVCTRSRNGRLSLRFGPGQNYGKIKEISNGNSVILNGSKYGDDGFRWWNVQHKGDAGWVRADYVCGDPE